MMAKLRVAIVGAGLIAPKKHIPAFLRQKDQAQIVAICDLNREAAQQVANRFGIPGVYTNVAEMLLQEKPDLVDICTPPQTHKNLAVEAMRAGAHILIEKPMALSVSDCDQIVNASKELKREVCVAHSQLFYYPIMEAKRLVEQGAIGEFRGMRILTATPADYMIS